MPKKSPKSIIVEGRIDCSYSSNCLAAKRCGRIKEVEIGRVLVDPNAPNLDTAYFQADGLAAEWSNFSEDNCTRSDNYLNGEPVIVIRGIPTTKVIN